MIDSVFIGISGLNGFSRGLKLIANNTANMNTPGFKGSALEFASLYYTHSGNGSTGSSGTSFGHGLNTLGTSVNFSAGELRQTGNNLDLAVDGEGFFSIKLNDGSTRYTRAGQFEFDVNGVLIHKTTGGRVIATGASGEFVNVNGLRTSPPGTTKTVTLLGNLSTGSSEHTIPGVRVFDSAGGEHVLSLGFNAIPAEPGSWTVSLREGDAEIATSKLTFLSGSPTAATNRLSFTYTPPLAPAQTITIDFSKDVTSFAAGAGSTLAFNNQDGFGVGILSSVSFDSIGQLMLTYSNGQTAKGARLLLGRKESDEALRPVGSNLFEVVDDRTWRTGNASSSGFGQIRAGSLELSNVNLTQEFSDLVIVQRGYQASSQIISTANEMLMQLFSMTSK